MASSTTCAYVVLWRWLGWLPRWPLFHDWFLCQPWIYFDFLVHQEANNRLTLLYRSWSVLSFSHHSCGCFNFFGSHHTGTHFVVCIKFCIPCTNEACRVKLSFHSGSSSTRLSSGSLCSDQRTDWWLVHQGIKSHAAHSIHCQAHRC